MPSFAHSTVLPVSLERPARYRVLRSYAGHLEFGPDAVYDCLLRLLEENAGNRGHLATNAAERLAVVQGAWWYRGEYVVRPALSETGAAGAASIIEFEIFNLPARWRRSGPLAARAVIAESPSVFQSLLSAISDELALALDH